MSKQIDIEKIAREARSQLDEYFQLLPDIKFGIAGGKVTRTLHNIIHNVATDVKSVDVDMYFSDKLELIKAHLILNKLCDHFTDYPALLTSSSAHVTHYNLLKNSLKIDTILEIESENEHLHNFDFNISKVMLCSDHFTYNKEAIEGIKNLTIDIAHTESADRTFSRLFKYAKIGYDPNRKSLDKIISAITVDLDKTPKYKKPTWNEVKNIHSEVVKNPNKINIADYKTITF